MHPNVLKTEGEKYGLTIASFNPLSCFGQADDLTEVKSSAGLSIWREDDAVHLTTASYGDIAAVLANQANTNSHAAAAATVRKRLLSVVPTQGASETCIREPEWISGQLRDSRRGGQRGGQHGGP